MNGNAPGQGAESSRFTPGLLNNPIDRFNDKEAIWT